MEWISVDDRLPDTYQEVLVFGNDEYNNLGRGVWIGYYRYDDWHIVNNGDYIDGGYGRDYINSKITHWMPLPKPPKQ